MITDELIRKALGETVSRADCDTIPLKAYLQAQLADKQKAAFDKSFNFYDIPSLKKALELIDEKPKAKEPVQSKPPLDGQGKPPVYKTSKKFVS